MSAEVEVREALDRLAQAAKDFNTDEGLDAVDEDYRLVGSALADAERTAGEQIQANFALTAQLQAAQAAITEVRNSAQAGLADCDDDCDMSAFWVLETLSRADTSAYDAAILAARAKTLKDAAVELKARGDALFESTEKAWQESEFGKLDTDWEHPGRDALADAAASGVMKRDAEWLKARAASIEQTEAE